jgi:hypothetical protein
MIHRLRLISLRRLAGRRSVLLLTSGYMRLLRVLGRFLLTIVVCVVVVPSVTTQGGVRVRVVLAGLGVGSARGVRGQYVDLSLTPSCEYPPKDSHPQDEEQGEKDDGLRRNMRNKQSKRKIHEHYYAPQ